jgi:peptidoglycan/xylan/chitin deacetylase (PgdA/CDA1 family)
MRRGLLLVIPALILAVASAYARPVGFAAVRAPMAQLAVDAFPDLPRPVTMPVVRTPPVPRIVLGVRTTRLLVALTFDLDMTPQMASMAHAGVFWVNTDAIGYLQSNEIHATLFMTGMWAEMYPTVARRLAENPNFEIGNHTYSHPAFHVPCYRLGWVNRSVQALQISFAQQAIQRVTGVTPRYFRFPGGCYDRQALDLVHAAGLVPIQWNVNSIDAFNPLSQQIASVVLSAVRPGSIVVMHLQGGANAPGTATSS